MLTWLPPASWLSSAFAGLVLVLLDLQTCSRALSTFHWLGLVELSHEPGLLAPPAAPDGVEGRSVSPGLTSWIQHQNSVHGFFCLFVCDLVMVVYCLPLVCVCTCVCVCARVDVCLHVSLLCASGMSIREPE